MSVRTRPSGRIISEADPRMDGVVEEEEEWEEERGTVAVLLLWRRVLLKRDAAAGLLLLPPPRRNGSIVFVEEEEGEEGILPRQMICNEKGRWSRTRALAVVGREERTQRKETRVVKQRATDGLELV